MSTSPSSVLCLPSDVAISTGRYFRETSNSPRYQIRATIRDFFVFHTSPRVLSHFPSRLLSPARPVSLYPSRLLSPARPLLRPLFSAFPLTSRSQLGVTFVRHLILRATKSARPSGTFSFFTQARESCLTSPHGCYRTCPPSAQLANTAVFRARQYFQNVFYVL